MSIDYFDKNGTKVGDDNVETEFEETNTESAENEQNSEPEEEKRSFKEKAKDFFEKVKSFAKKENDTKLDPINSIISGAVYKEVKQIFKKICDTANRILNKLGPVGTIARIIKKVACIGLAAFAVGYIGVKAICLLPKVLPVIIAYAATSLIAVVLMNVFNNAFNVNA